MAAYVACCCKDFLCSGQIAYALLMHHALQWTIVHSPLVVLRTYSAFSLTVPPPPPGAPLLDGKRPSVFTVSYAGGQSAWSDMDCGSLQMVWQTRSRAMQSCSACASAMMGASWAWALWMAASKSLNGPVCVASCISSEADAPPPPPPPTLPGG